MLFFYYFVLRFETIKQCILTRFFKITLLKGRYDETWFILSRSQSNIISKYTKNEEGVCSFSITCLVLHLLNIHCFKHANSLREDDVTNLLPLKDEHLENKTRH